MLNYAQIQEDIKAVIARVKALEETLPSDVIIIAEAHYIRDDLVRLGKLIKEHERRQVKAR